MGFGRMGGRPTHGSMGAGSHQAPAIPSGPPYTLVASTGSFILTGDDMAPLVDRRIPADVGTFALTGQAATLTYSNSVATTTLDPAFASGGTHTLTNGNLTATGNGSFGCVRSVASYSSGKYYWEVTTTTVNTTIVGIVKGSETNNHFLGQTSNSNGINAGASAWWDTASISGAAPGGVAGHVMAYAMDLDNRKIWVKDITAGGNWNNDASGDPATNSVGRTMGGNFATGAIYAAVACVTNGNNVTFNFGASAYAGTPPSGFGNM